MPRLAPWQERLAKDIMGSQISSRVQMQQIPRSCRLSLSYFIRAFGDSVGVAPYRWLLDERVERAKRLLSETNVSLAEIALDCGFVDQSHLTNVFGRRVGTTPGRWRAALPKA